jgi:hypothetical protein
MYRRLRQILESDAAFRFGVICLGLLSVTLTIAALLVR